MKEAIDLLGKIITNILTALYEPFGFSLLLSFLAMFFYLYAYEPIHAGKGWKSTIVTWYQKFKESEFFRKLFFLAFVTSLILFRTLLNRQLWMNPLSDVNPETMQQVGDLSVPEYLTRWLRESVMNLFPDTYGRYAYDMGRVIIPYFKRKRLSLKALTPRDLETFFRYERQQEEATVQQLLDWHRELSDALQYAVDSNWLKANPVKTVDPCLDNSPVLFNDFLMDWLKMMKSRVAITTYANYEIVITRRIVPYAERAGAESEGLRQKLLHRLS